MNRALGQRGVALILLALLLPLLLAAISIAIDYTLLTSSIQQARAQARILALQAVEDFHDDSLEPSIGARARLDLVLRRVSMRAQSNQIIGLGAEHNPVELRSDEERENVAYLIPGNYFVDWISEDECTRLPSGCGGPCNDLPDLGRMCVPCQNGENLPCFVPIAESDVRDGLLKPSAFRVEAETYRGITFPFLRPLLGDARASTTVSATAAIVPRRLMALVDASRSASRENYLFRAIEAQELDQATGRGSQYAFSVEALPNGVYLCNDHDRPENRCSYPQVWWSEGPNPVFGSRNSEYLHWKFLRHFAQLGSDGTPQYTDGGVRRQFPTSDSIHYYDDYGLRRTISSPSDPRLTQLGIDPTRHQDPQACGGAQSSRYCATSEKFMIDVRSRGPRPFTTILAGLRSAVDSLDSRRLAGDEMGIYFFDRRPIWTRLVPPSADFDYLASLLEDSSAGWERRWALRMMPTRGGYTDLVDAVAEGYLQLATRRQANPGLQTKDDILLFTDGLSNCAQCQGGQGTPAEGFDLDGNGTISSSDVLLYFQCQCAEGGQVPSGCARCLPPGSQSFFELLDVMSRCDVIGCQNDWAHYSASMTRLKEIVRASAGTGIAINIVAVGDHIGTHIVDHVSEGRCLSSEEMITADLLPVRPSCAEAQGEQTCEEAFSTMGPQNPFNEAVRDLYLIARASGGEFLPLFRQQAPHCGVTPELCRDQPSHPSCCGDGTVWTTDKFCRTPQEQIEDFIGAILDKQNPIALVEGN